MLRVLVVFGLNATLIFSLIIIIIIIIIMLMDIDKIGTDRLIPSKNYKVV